MGEKIALEYLLERGFFLLEKNWRNRHKEVDLIMRDAYGIHFVEVRSRREPVMVRPERTVDFRKQRNLISAASAYVSSFSPGTEIFFDIVAVIFKGEGYEVEYIPNAYFPIY